MSISSPVARQGEQASPADDTPKPGANRRMFLPSRSIRDVLWLLVVSAFVVVLLASMGAMSVFVFVFPDAQTPQVLLILFTAAAGFLGGLFAPSPLGVNQSHDSSSAEGAHLPG